MSGHAYKHIHAYCTQCTLCTTLPGAQVVVVLTSNKTSLQLPPRWLFSSLTVSHYRTVGKGWGSEETEAGPALSPAALPSPNPTVLGPPAVCPHRSRDRLVRMPPNAVPGSRQAVLTQSAVCTGALE